LLAYSSILALTKMCGITHIKAVKLKVKLRHFNTFSEYINWTVNWSKF